jgi:7,8-dihydropterin-6-yl-methyl-4-(beta-D-ribofuranosyl)aminobenzene 5'-phosphate synthase
MIKLHCMVENSAKRGSALWGEHGLSFWIETPGGQILFDTGQSGDVFVHNEQELGLDLKQIDALAVSHAHYDHTGGFARVLPRMRPNIPLYANPDLFRERFSRYEGEYRSIGLRMSREELERHVDLRLSAQPSEIIPGVWTTGEIAERSYFEGRSRGHVVRKGEEWQPDPYQDDLSLVLDGDEGLVVLCGCCHAGLLNTLRHVRHHFEGEKIAAVIGGTHLNSATGEMLDEAVEHLRSTYDSPRLYVNHCTGERAYLALAKAFGDRVEVCPAGMVLDL